MLFNAILCLCYIMLQFTANMSDNEMEADKAS